jgi:hypothetical protein
MLLNGFLHPMRRLQEFRDDHDGVVVVERSGKKEERIMTERSCHDPGHVRRWCQERVAILAKSTLTKSSIVKNLEVRREYD